ncbi:MAG: META domain-containing protein [Alphaproteobacteria bacterium]|nr:META domain-containing protein [Alphaproteobacteria bacterium]
MKKILNIICALFLFGCNQADVKLSGNYKMINAPENAEITLSFEENNFSGLAAVNRYFGTFEQNKNIVKFNVAGLTMMMGPENMMQAEQDYIKFLSSVNSFVFENGLLILKTVNDNELKFEKI